MRSEVAKRILTRTPEHVRISTHWYADLMIHISNALKSKGISQKELAASMGKQPSEINKWLKGEHNFTLSSLAKLQAELGVILIEIPFEKKNMRFRRKLNGTTFIIHKSIPENNIENHQWVKPIYVPNETLSYVGS